MNENNKFGVPLKMRFKYTKIWLLSICALSLAACGGGGDESDSRFGYQTEGGDRGEGEREGGGSGGSGGSGGGGTIPTGNGSATVSWTIPTSRMDGSALSMTEISGYKVYYGISPSNLIGLVTVNDPYQQQQVLSGLATGVPFYFGVSLVDINGLESPVSKLVSKTM